MQSKATELKVVLIDTLMLLNFMFSLESRGRKRREAVDSAVDILTPGQLPVQFDPGVEVPSLRYVVVRSWYIAAVLLFLLSVPSFNITYHDHSCFSQPFFLLRINVLFQMIYALEIGTAKAKFT